MDRSESEEGESAESESEEAESADSESEEAEGELKEAGSGEVESEEVECTEPGCSSEAAVRLHIPWAENRVVCPACARGLVQQDGVVAEPLTGHEEAWS